MTNKALSWREIYYLFISSLFVVDEFCFNLQLDKPSTNSKACLKTLVRWTTLQNVGIINTRHLRQNLSLWCKLKWTWKGQVFVQNIFQKRSNNTGKDQYTFCSLMCFCWHETLFQSRQEITLWTLQTNPQSCHWGWWI